MPGPWNPNEPPPWSDEEESYIMPPDVIVVSDPELGPVVAQQPPEWEPEDHIAMPPDAVVVSDPELGATIVQQPPEWEPGVDPGEDRSVPGSGMVRKGLSGAGAATGRAAVDAGAFEGTPLDPYADPEGEMVFGEDEGMIIERSGRRGGSRSQSDPDPLNPLATTTGFLEEGVRQAGNLPDSAQLLDPYAEGAPQEDQVRDPYDFANMSTEELEGLALEEKRLSDQKQLDLRQRAIDFEADHIRRNEARHQKYMEDIRARQERVLAASEEVMNARISYRGSASQKFANVLAAVLGGVSAGRHGGRNIGLEAVMRNIDRDIDAQKAELANKRASIGQQQNAIGQLMRLGLEERDAEQAYRVGMMRNFANQIAMEQAKYDVAGTTGARLALARRAAEEAAAQKQMEHQRELLTWANTEAKREAETEKLYHDMDMKERDFAWEQQKEALRRRAAAMAASRKKSNFPTLDQQMKAAEKGMQLVQDESGNWVVVSSPQASTRKPLSEMTQEEILNLPLQELERQRAAAELVSASGRADKYGSEAQIKEAEATSGPGGTPFGMAGPDGSVLRKSDGSVWQIPSSQMRDKANATIEAATSVRRIVDELKVLHDKAGGEFHTLNTADSQRYKALVQSLDFALVKANELGVITGGDAMYVKNARGGVDPASFMFNATSGLEAVASETESKMNDKLRTGGFGYDGEPIRVPRSDVARAVSEDTESLIGDITSPLAPHALRDPEKRAAELDRRKRRAEVWARRELTDKQINRAAAGVRELVESGAMDKAEAIDVLRPIISKRISQKGWAKAGGASMSKPEGVQRMVDALMSNDIDTIYEAILGDDE